MWTRQSGTAHRHEPSLRGPALARSEMGRSVLISQPHVPSHIDNLLARRVAFEVGVFEVSRQA